MLFRLIALLLLASCLMMDTASAKDAPTPTPNVYPAEIGFGCAPWDGPTLDVKVGVPGTITAVHIWAEGYEDLQKGERTIAINNKQTGTPGVKATGQANVCTATPPNAPVCKDKDLTVVFTTLELKNGGMAKGYIKDTATIPFEGHITSRMPCG